jgi:hypothetical protein
LISRKRGRSSNRALGAVFRETVLAIVRERYADFGPTLAAEKLCERCAATTFAGSSARGRRAVLKEQLIRYRPGREPKPESRTDWDRLNRMSDEEIDRAALADPDAQPLSDEQLARGFRPKALTALRKRLGLSQAEVRKTIHAQPADPKGLGAGAS